MIKNGTNSGSNNNYSTAVERASYHNPQPSGGQTQERRCDNCQYKVALNEC